MVKRFVQRRCPKCGGNVYLDMDYYGWYEKCLQCGYSRDLDAILEAQSEAKRGQSGAG